MISNIIDTNNMEKELGFDIIYGVESEDLISELSYTTFAEELQVQEVLKASSQLLLEDFEMEDQLERAFNFNSSLKDEEVAVAQDSEKCTVSVQQQHSSGLGCNSDEQQKKSWDVEGNENFRETRARHWKGATSRRHSQSNLKGKGTSSQTRGKGIVVADAENNRDLPVSKRKTWKPNSRAKGYWGTLKQNRGNFVKANEIVHHHNVDVVTEDDYDTLDDDEDEDDDSDASQKSHESRKKSKWFKEFFERMDALNAEEMNETVWHCPACQGGPGAIKWYRSIHDLIAHSNKIGGKRVKLHRQLAELLEEELSRNQTSISIAQADQTVLGNWKGLKEDASDHDIVWPPMVVIMNTMTSIYKDGKCVGMRSHELLEHFSSYPALKAKHSYGPQGHRGLSVLIFESSAIGYLEAERLHKAFVQQGLDRFAWNSCPDVILPGGERQLYGFMAMKEDLDILNLQYFQGKSTIKYELKSYEEVVLNEIKRMKEDSLELMWLKERVGEERKRAQTLEESVQNLSRNLQLKLNDIHIFQQRVQLLHQQNNEEMDCQENFYKDQIKILEAKVKELEKLQESNANPLPLHREEETILNESALEYCGK